MIIFIQYAISQHASHYSQILIIKKLNDKPIMFIALKSLRTDDDCIFSTADR
jgi:hypothetical protein